MVSKKYTLNEVEKQKIFENARLYLVPALLVFLTAIQAGVSMKDALMAVYLWALNTVIDILKKYLAGK